MSKTVLVATDKPFAKVAVEGIREIVEKAGYKLELLEKYTHKEQLFEAIQKVHAVIIRSDKITQEVLEHAQNLEICVRAGAGYDNVDLEAAKQKKVVVMNTPGQNSAAVAELAIGMMLYMARGKFNGKTGSEIGGKRLGLHACGNVGRAVARMAKGFGMEVWAYDPYVSGEKLKEEGIIPAQNVEELYQKCQYVSLHIPATSETKKSIGKKLLSLMPPNAVLINTARKEVIHEEELQEILKTRPDFQYLSDIIPDCAAELEKACPSQVFWTPQKMGAQTEEANVNAGLAAAKQIVQFFKTGDKTFQVNP